MSGRWDLTLQFLSGPLSVRPPPMALGPDIHLGRRLKGQGSSRADHRGIVEHLGPVHKGVSVVFLGAEYHDVLRSNETCGGVLPNQTQHDAYSIIAQHLLAACDYGRHATDRSAFRPYAGLWKDGGYCRTLDIPDPFAVRER